jgi:hypothetical protein
MPKGLQETVADPNQTPARGEWACPCSGCAKAVAYERKQLIELFEQTKRDYIVYRGGSLSEDGSIAWAKDDALSFAEGIDSVIELIKERMPKPKVRK